MFLVMKLLFPYLVICVREKAFVQKTEELYLFNRLVLLLYRKKSVFVMYPEILTSFNVFELLVEFGELLAICITF